MQGKDLETSEEYLLGCITLLKRRFQGRADRDRIRDDLRLLRGLEKYEREMKFITKASDNAITVLIASSIDLAMEVRRMREILERIQYANFDEDEVKRQTTKAELANSIMTKIVQVLKKAEIK